MNSSLSSTGKNDEDVREQKQAMRKEIRAAIKTLDADDIQSQSSKVWKRVIDLPEYKNAKSIGLFLSMPTGELNTDELIANAIRNNKDMYVPRVGKNFERCDMELVKVILSEQDKSKSKLFHKEWPKNKWKIPEPPEDMPTVIANPGDIDILIVPGLGFDRRRNRIGQGKGYYDRFIARMINDETPMPLIAVGLTPQLIEVYIPMAEYDRRMDMVITPDEVIRD